MTTPDTGQLGAWLEAHGLSTLILLILALVAFSLTRPIVHRLIVRAAERRARLADAEQAELTAEEARKRVSTVEDLVSTVLKFTVVLVAILVLLTIFDLFPVVAGLGIALAALTLAGQSIVLDYLMGILIVVEGPFYKGDWIQAGGVEGEVEEIGLRRTILRDATGTVHSVSNGTVRVASNLTRVFARMVIDVPVAFATDLDQTTAIVNEVGRSMAADPEWSGRLLETPHLQRVDALGELGPTLRIVGRVRAADRWSAPGELRRRLVAAFQANGIAVPAHGRSPSSPLPGDRPAVPAATATTSPAAFDASATADDGSTDASGGGARS